MKHYVRGFGRVPIVPRPLTEDEREAIAHAVAHEMQRRRERQVLMGIACGDQLGKGNQQGGE